MSVQAGVWNLDGRSIERDAMNELSASLTPFGPDGEALHLDGPIALLYRPFHTTLESRFEKQPYISRRGFIVTWDGRLDNRKNLINELRFDLDPGPSDVAIVAAAFDRWETESLRRIVGDWAITVWQPRKRELVLGSDFMGVRHLFYHLAANQLRWSTDIGALVLVSERRFHVDDEFIAGYLAHNPEGYATPYREIRQVAPGQYVRIQPGKCVQERFWRSSSSRIRYKADVEYEEHFRYLFRQSVGRRLRSDAPVLAELSGGLDSSSIVCMADDILASGGAETPGLETLSFYDKTEPKGEDWIYFQKIEAKRGKAGVHIDGSRLGHAPTSLECQEFLPFPGALGASRELLEERACAIRVSGARAVLSGLGGDEFMGGVPDPRAQLADLLVSGRFVRLARQLTAWSLIKRRPWMHLLWGAAVEALPPSLGRFFDPLAKIEPWIKKDFATRTRLALRQVSIDHNFGLWLPTRRGMICGVQVMANNMAKTMATLPVLEETRYPYLDQDLIEFVLSTPADQWLRPGERRSLMRRSLKEIVPEEVLARKSKQIAARTPIVMLDTHWGEIQNVYRDSLSASLGYVNETELLKTINQARAGKQVPIVRVLWTISLEFWLRDMAARGLLELPAASSKTDQKRQPTRPSARVQRTEYLKQGEPL